MTVQDRLQRHPQMRASTLAYLQKRDALLAQLQREIREQAEADRAGYTRRPSMSETLLRRSVRAFSEFVSQIRTQ